MTSRELVLAALNHQETERVPVDLGGLRCSGIMAIAYAKLKKALGVTSGDIYVYDIIQQLAIVEPEVLDILGVDTIEMGRGFLLKDSDWKPWVLPDGTSCKIPYYINPEKQDDGWYLYSNDGKPLAVQKKGCLYFEEIHFPLIERGIENDDFSDLAEQFDYIMWTKFVHPGAHLPLDDTGLHEMADRAKELRESTDKAIIGLFGGNIFEFPQWLYRMDNYLTYLRLYPDAVHRLSEKLCSVYMNNLEKWLGTIGEYIDIILFADDLGSQNAPLISPDMYREFFKLYHKRMWKRAKELANVKVMLHCCGAIGPLLDDLIDAGIDAVNPVQISCKTMAPHCLKDRFGDRLCFWGGGCDTRDILPRGTPKEVAKHVRKQVSILSRNGGFVFNQVHNIMADVPPENIISMFEIIKKTNYSSSR